MSRFSLIIRRSVFALAASLLLIASPLSAFAQEAPTTGPIEPQGPEASTYTYNPDTKMWENAYYIWNPATNQTTPKTSQTYSYNPATGRWDTTDWIYDAAKGAYVPNVVSVVQPPAGAATEGGPAAAELSTEGPNSPVGIEGSSTGIYDNFYNASISNTLNQTAKSGNAAVTLNTTGGNALSGNATNMANVLNLLMSSAAPLQNGLATFTQNIYGDVQGDILIDPSQLPSSASLSSNNAPNNLTINSKATGVINNNITLDSTSGDATVSQNTTGGNATTGNANAVADIMNVINSVIGSGSSFMGTVNIFGNLDGDILMPPDTLNSLLASGGSPTIVTQGPNSPINSEGDNTLNAKLTNNTNINNLVNLSAVTGAAQVSNNTAAGNATTGNAETNLTVLNLTGQQIIGKDAVLVFVNVLGKWVGMIVNAPSGATSAALGGGITTAGPNSPIAINGDSTTNLNYENNSSINNNVNASALSGNALVTSNTRAGNAASGNATASVNLLNISSSSLSLSNWLGILFINVFGSWNGSFGIDTAAGDRPQVAGVSNTENTTAASVKAVKVFSFIPAAGSDNSYRMVQLASADNPAGGSDDKKPMPLVAVSTDTTPKSPARASRSNSLFLAAGSLFLLAGILGGQELITRRKEARAQLRKYLSSVTVPPLKRY